MKKIFYIIFASMLFAATGCQQPTYDELGELPSAYDLEIDINCDQDLNNVTFTCSSTGMLPVWYFEDGTISSDTVVERYYGSAGTYTIEVKAMDPNGMSADSQTLQFTINSDYVSPETQTMIEALCGSLDGSTAWMWNYTVDGHFGCGESGSDEGNNWWSVWAYECWDSGMYENTMTFDASGAYAYDPGENGYIYVNEGVTLSQFTAYSPDSGSGYTATTTAASGTWSFSSDGTNNYIELSSGMLAGYLPYDDLYTSPKFRIITLEENHLVMIADNGGISWRYEFVPVTE